MPKPLPTPAASPKPLTREQEAERLLLWYGKGGIEPLMGVLSSQLTFLHNRAQVLLTLGGIGITVTGFSGRLIAGTDRWAQAAIIGGLALILIAVGLVVQVVMGPGYWVTQVPGEDVRAWLLGALEMRDRRTRVYRIALALLLVGLALYTVAVTLMLVLPGQGALSTR